MPQLTVHKPQIHGVRSQHAECLFMFPGLKHARTLQGNLQVERSSVEDSMGLDVFTPYKTRRPNMLPQNS